MDPAKIAKRMVIAKLRHIIKITTEMVDHLEKCDQCTLTSGCAEGKRLADEFEKAARAL